MHQGHEFEERETEIVWTSSRYYSFKMALAPQRYLPSQQGLTLLYAGEQLKGDRQAESNVTEVSLLGHSKWDCLAGVIGRECGMNRFAVLPSQHQQAVIHVHH